MKKAVCLALMLVASGYIMAQTEKPKAVQAETTASMEVMPVPATADEVRKKEKDQYLDALKAEQAPLAEQEMQQRKYLDEKRRSIQEEKNLSEDERAMRLKELDEIQAGKKKAATASEQKATPAAPARKKAPATVAP